MKYYCLCFINYIKSCFSLYFRHVVFIYYLLPFFINCMLYMFSLIDSSRRRAPAVANTESIEAYSLRLSPLGRPSMPTGPVLGTQSLCSTRFELAPPGGGPHGEHGAAQGPHSTPAQDTEAVVRPSHLLLPPAHPDPVAQDSPAWPEGLEVRLEQVAKGDSSS